MKELLKVIDTPWGKIDSIPIEAAIAACSVIAVTAAAVIGVKVCTDEKAADNIGRVVEKFKGERKANT